MARKGRGAQRQPPAAVAEGLAAAAAHYRAGRAEAAEGAYRAVLEADPDQPDALFALGVLALKAGRDEAAAGYLARFTKIRPGHAEGLNTLALALTRLGRPAEAEAACREAVRVRPGFAEAWANLGAARQDQGRPEAAEEALERAVSLNPRLVFAHNNLGLARMARGRPEAAAKAYRAALALAPDHPVLHGNLGNALRELGDLAGAADAHRRAIALDGDSAEAHNNLGTVLARMDRLEEARAAYERAVALRPSLADAHLNLGSVLRTLRLDDGAAAAFRRALALRPDDGQALGMLVQVEKRRCDWDAVAPLERRVHERIAAGDGGLPPLVTLGLDTTPAEQLAAARSHVNRACAPYRDAPLPPPPAPGPRGRLTVGYLSADFGDHPVGHLIAALLPHHDRDAVAVAGYALSPPDGSAPRARIEAACDRFADLHAAPVAAAARRIREDGVDVLIDLGGHTRDARPGILALRPAPVQAAYLGYAGTTGADFVDYVLADRFVLPPELEPHFSEAPVRLPGCYMAAEPPGDLPEPPDRAACGLPPDGFVFCAFNRTEKVTPGMFDRWMGLLADVPGSVLWLSPAGEAATDHLRAAARNRGVDPDRLRFAGRVPEARDHLARLRHAGLFLDTRPYNAHATAVDALRAGVPVLTCPGRTFASRVAGSLLNALGLDELCAPDPEAYGATARRLATDPAALADLRRRLAAASGGAPFDPAAQARHVERACRMMWDRHAAGAAPAPVTVPLPGD
jgi:protein O-GlcNAc transferase